MLKYATVIPQVQGFRELEEKATHLYCGRYSALAVSVHFTNNTYKMVCTLPLPTSHTFLKLLGPISGESVGHLFFCPKHP